MTAQDESEIARAELGKLRVSVRIDGEWVRELRWYTRDLPVFIHKDGSEVDICDDGSVRYHEPSGGSVEITADDETDGVRTFTVDRPWPVDTIEVHETDLSTRSEPADFGGGESTGVQEL